MSSYVSSIAGQLINERELKNVRITYKVLETIINVLNVFQFVGFLKENMQYLEKAKIGVRQALEGAESNVQWHKNHYNDAERVLGKYVHK